MARRLPCRIRRRSRSCGGRLRLQAYPFRLEAIRLVSEDLAQPALVPPRKRADYPQHRDGHAPRDRPPSLGRLDAIGRVGAEHEVRLGVVEVHPVRDGNLFRWFR